jgi:hypothetical protein
MPEAVNIGTLLRGEREKGGPKPAFDRQYLNQITYLDSSARRRPAALSS